VGGVFRLPRRISASNRQATFYGICPACSDRRIKNRRSFKANDAQKLSSSFHRIGIGLVFTPSARLSAQQRTTHRHRHTRNGQNQEVDRSSASAPTRRSSRLRSRPAGVKGAYKTWLDQDVSYIISDEEARLQDSLERRGARRLYRKFWLRRNPTDSPKNESAKSTTGASLTPTSTTRRQARWKTDRAHLHSFGPADSIDSHPQAQLPAAMDEGGAKHQRSLRDLHYRYLEASAKTSTSSLWIAASAATTIHHRPQREGRAVARSRAGHSV